MLSGRLKDLLAVRGISKDNLAEICDLPIETIRNIYYGKTSDPKISTVMKIANALNITVDCLIKENSRIPEENELLHYYWASGEHGRSLISQTAKYEALAAKDEREAVGKRKIPCIMPHGNIYEGIVYDACETVEIYTSDPNAYAAIKLDTNDMVPLYCKGDTILIEDRFPENHEYGVFYKDGRAHIWKFIEEDNQYVLRYRHNYGEDMYFKRLDEIEYIGTCCGVVRA